MTALALTYSGRVIDIEKFSESDIDLRDIAFSLSRQRRYNGHTSFPWSVGQHIIFCTMIAEVVGATGKEKLAVFLHDVEETWTQDISYHIKSNFMLNKFKKVSNNISRVVYRFFGAEDLYDDNNVKNLIKSCDEASALFEIKQLFPEPTLTYFVNNGYFKKQTLSNVEYLEQSGLKGIPKDLLNMNENDIAQQIFEILNVAHTEKQLGGEIVVDNLEEDDKVVPLETKQQLKVLKETVK